ncbi:MAG: phage tail protein, partial [Sneathiella sp.]
MTSMNGEVVTNGSLWKIYPAVWRAPSKSLDEDDFRGGQTTKARRPRKELYNGVRGTFKSPDNEYQLADYPAVISDAFIAMDGKENFLDIELPFTQSAATAQRIAKILLLENRQQITTSWELKMTAWSIEAADNVQLNRTKLGWVEKYFKVKRAPTVIENGKMGVKLEMVETDPSIYDWSTDEEITIDPAPNTNLPNPMYISEPASITLESGSDLQVVDSAGQVHSQLQITIAPPVDAFVKEYQVEWLLSDGLIWNEFTIPAKDAGNTQFVLSPVFDLKTYHVRAFARSRFGAESDYVEATPHLVQGKTEDPSDVDRFTILIQPDGTRLFDAAHPLAEAD